MKLWHVVNEASSKYPTPLGLRKLRVGLVTGPTQFQFLMLSLFVLLLLFVLLFCLVPCVELAWDQYTTLGWGRAVPVKCILNIHTFQALDNGFAVNK